MALEDLSGHGFHALALFGLPLLLALFLDRA
jgi:hypothetical protein